MAKTVVLKLDQVKCSNENHCLDMTSGTFTGSLNFSDPVGFGDWKMEVVSNELVFSYNGVKVAKIGTDGLITSANDLAAFGTI